MKYLGLALWSAPAFGLGNTILFVMAAQVFTLAAIDHFALFGVALRPVSVLRAIGPLFLPVGLAISQLADGGGPQ